MANKKTTAKSSSKSNSKSGATIKPFDGKITPFGSNKSYEPKSKAPAKTVSKPTASTKKVTPSKSSSSKVTDKKVVKKDGKVTVTYSTPYKSTLGTYPSKVRKIYDDKGNLVKGNQRVQGSYGSSYDIGIKGKKKATDTTTKTSTPKITKAPVKKPIVSGKNVTSKEGAAKIKGIVEGLERPTTKKATTKAKPVAPKMATTIGSAKASVPSKGKVKIEPNLGKPKSYTPPKVETKKVETKKVETKAAPKPELIKMETISSAKAAEQLMESRNLPTQLAGVKAPASAPEEKKGLFARLREKREARKAEKEAEKNSTAKMKKGGIIKKYKKK
jgi:hypothetical protein